MPAPSTLYVPISPFSFVSLHSLYAYPEDMPDAPDSPRRSNNAHAAHLQYPTLPPLSASVEEWLSRSRPTNNMTSDRLGDPQSKSLSESWATLSVSDLHSEDGSRSGQTDADSLIDHTSPDDVASLDEPYSTSEAGTLDEEYPQEDDEAGEEESPITGGSQQFPSLFAPDAAIDDSNLTTRPAFRQPSESIEFIEPEKWPEIERVELKHTIRIFEEEAASEMKNRLRNPSDCILMATVQQTMTKQGLDLDKPFRVLYVGHPDFRNIILDKIGDVLVSSSSAGSQTSSAESSRYHVVPTSFGAGAVPNFAELLPIHVQLVVDECVEATAAPDLNHPSALHLAFKNRPSCHSWWNGTEFRVSSDSEWTLPDMAIFFVSHRDDPAAVQTRSLAHTFLERHGIPAMMISEEPLWKHAGESVPVNHNSLHMCLESRDPRTGDTMVIKRYPIDLKTFESITPSQLNRNLASLMDLYPKKAVKVTAEPPSSISGYSFIDPEKYPYSLIPPSYTTKAREVAPLLRLLTLTLVSAIVLSLGYAAVKAVVILLAQWVAGSSLSNALSSTTPALPTNTLSPDGIRHTSITTRQSGHLDVVPNKSVGCVVGKQATGFTIPTSNYSETPDAFEIHVVGDCHVVIKPPRNFASSRKQPRFNVSVRRFDKALPHELSRLFEGVYTMRLDREHAYGLVNVTVTAKSNPSLNQTSTVDFGTPWLKIANWKRAARMISTQVTKDLQTAQTGLSIAYDRLSTDLQVIVGDVVKMSHYLRDDSAQDTVLSRSKQISEVLTRNAMQKFQSVSSVLHRRSAKVDQETRNFFSDAWSRLGESAAKVDLRSMMDRVRDAKCATLDRAQARARHFMRRRDVN